MSMQTTGRTRSIREFTPEQVRDAARALRGRYEHEMDIQVERGRLGLAEAYSRMAAHVDTLARVYTDAEVWAACEALVDRTVEAAHMSRHGDQHAHQLETATFQLSSWLNARH